MHKIGLFAGLVYARFAETGKRDVLVNLRKDHALAMAAAEALKRLEESLTSEQRQLRDQIIACEMARQLAHLPPPPTELPAFARVEG